MSATFDNVLATKETAKALLVVIDGVSRWVPKSAVDDDSEVYGEGHQGRLVVAEWWAVKENLAEPEDESEPDTRPDWEKRW